MPLLSLPPYVVPVCPILLASLDQKVRTVITATEVTLQILPATVGLERTSRMGAAIGTERLGLGQFLGLCCIAMDSEG